MKFKVVISSAAFLCCKVYALPEPPVIDRDVHMTETRVNNTTPSYTRPTIPAFQTSADGRIGMSHKIVESGRVVFRLQVPEKIETSFVNSQAGTNILSRPNSFASSAASLPASQIAGDFSSHLGLCDPSFDPDSITKNPRVCGNDDCYDMVLIRSGNVDNNSNLRTIYGTPVSIRVTAPKTTNASIAEVTTGEPVQGGTFPLNAFFEPMTTGDGRLLFARVNASTEITWTDSENNSRTTTSDNVYFVNDNPENQRACDVTQWDKVYPLGHAPYDDTINQRYGFAMQLFRDTTNKVIPDGNPIGTYPWIDKGGDNISFTTVGTNLYNPRTGESEYNTRCVVPMNQCEDDLDSQNGGALNGRIMMGLWTRGKMVLLDNIINNIDFTLHGDDIAHREVQLYETNGNSDGYTRVGNGRDNRVDFLPAGGSGNTTFFDSNEHRFNYLPNMRPVTPADVTWLVSSGRGTTEVPFDDYLNPDSFINANMAQTIELRANGARRPIAGQVQNAATGGRVLHLNNERFEEPEWTIPSHGQILGNARVEPVVKGGVHGKGFWMNGEGSGLQFQIPRQSRPILGSPWYYSIFMNVRDNQNGDKALLTFPDDSGIRIRDGNTIVFIDSSGEEVNTFDMIQNIPDNGWVHLGFQLRNRNETVITYVNGYRTNLLNHDTALFQLSPGNLTIGRSLTPTTIDHYRGWVDDFKVFADSFNVEVACNQASGTLVGINGTISNRWRRLANNLPVETHNLISQELRRNNKM